MSSTHPAVARRVLAAMEAKAAHPLTSTARARFDHPQ